MRHHLIRLGAVAGVWLGGQAAAERDAAEVSSYNHEMATFEQLDILSSTVSHFLYGARLLTEDDIPMIESLRERALALFKTNPLYPQMVNHPAWEVLYAPRAQAAENMDNAVAEIISLVYLDRLLRTSPTEIQREIPGLVFTRREGHVVLQGAWTSFGDIQNLGLSDGLRGALNQQAYARGNPVMMQLDSKMDGTAVTVMDARLRNPDILYPRTIGQHYDDLAASFKRMSGNELFETARKAFEIYEGYGVADMMEAFALRQELVRRMGVHYRSALSHPFVGLSRHLQRVVTDIYENLPEEARYAMEHQYDIENGDDYAARAPWAGYPGLVRPAVVLADAEAKGLSPTWAAASLQADVTRLLSANYSAALADALAGEGRVKGYAMRPDSDIEMFFSSTPGRGYNVERLSRISRLRIFQTEAGRTQVQRAYQALHRSGEVWNRINEGWHPLTSSGIVSVLAYAVEQQRQLQTEAIREYADGSGHVLPGPVWQRRR